MTKKVAIHWFRQDLRISDNPGLANAAKHDCVLPIYILDEESAGDYSMGGASRWWLHHSLKSLKASLNGNLSVYKAKAQDVFSHIMECFEVEAIYWNRCYEPWRINRDTHLKKYLKLSGIEVNTYNASLLWEPWEIKKDDGTQYKVFTPFYRRGCLAYQEPRRPLAKPQKVNYGYDQTSLKIEDLNLIPKIPWYKQLEPHWEIGENAADKRLQKFINQGLCCYLDGRNFPAKAYTSRLSAHICFGEISPNQIWYAVREHADNEHVYTFCSELGWREFSYSQLYYNPKIPFKNLQPKFDLFPWLENKEHLKSWQKGLTGVPMVDAGMRELWQTGFMHNRVRMIVGSFLVKNLRLNWQHGERWFRDTLVDADLASNSASWQWIAGCGADAAPYFRVFNPVMQGQKFDQDGEYIRKYIPEIAELPNKYIFSPWEAPDFVLDSAKIRLGVTYPYPIVSLKHSRDEAILAFKSLK